MFLHPTTANLVNLEVAKVFTIINLTKPLPKAVNAQFDNGEIHKVEVSCPCLPPICSHCTEVGHSIRRCPIAPITCVGCKSSTHVSEECPRAKKTVLKKETGETSKRLAVKKVVKEVETFTQKKKKSSSQKHKKKKVQLKKLL